MYLNKKVFPGYWCIPTLQVHHCKQSISCKEQFFYLQPFLQTCHLILSIVAPCATWLFFTAIPGSGRYWKISLNNSTKYQAFSTRPSGKDYNKLYLLPQLCYRLYSGYDTVFFFSYRKRWAWFEVVQLSVRTSPNESKGMGIELSDSCMSWSNPSTTNQMWHTVNFELGYIMHKL